MYRPLADELRPRTIEEVVGQRHLFGQDAVLRRVIENGATPNMVFYGPPGTGKTTVAGIIADASGRALYKLNATTASLADIKAIIADVDTLLTADGILLYLDEIQYFNKKQQQSLLEFMENGKITLIASTTENPYFYVYGAILSRSTVFEFRPVSPEEVIPVIERALKKAGERAGAVFEAEPEAIRHIAASCGGDVRKSINAVEFLASAARPEGGRARITLEDTLTVSQRSAMRYDRDGDQHFDILSALQKSIRGSDPDAGVHYLGRLLEAGDMLSPCRRLMVIAAEDVGLAYPQAITIVKSCVDAALQLGLPEARIPLSEAVLLLATAPKSNSAICAIDSALDDIKKGNSGDIPAHLKDTHYSGAQKLGRGGYKYAHSYENHYVKQQYLPDEIKDARYYEYGDNKNEQAAKKYWDGIKK